jgi:hypothetical protein
MGDNHAMDRSRPLGALTIITVFNCFINVYPYKVVVRSPASIEGVAAGTLTVSVSVEKVS